MSAANHSRPERIILISGPMAVGKSTLTQLLAEHFGFQTISTSELLAERTAANRRSLQNAGALLDQSTAGKWVLDELKKLQSEHEDATQLVVDAVRTREQIRWVRDVFGDSVAHIHLIADGCTLSGRYESRSGSGTYNEARAHHVEKEVHTLAASANFIVDTAEQGPLSVLERLASNLGLKA